MQPETKLAIKQLIESKIKDKLKNYEAETTHSPFFEAIFGSDTILKASIMTSLYTSFGMSIYEQIAVILAKSAGYTAERQFVLLGCTNDKTELLINSFCSKRGSNKEAEIVEIRKMLTKGIAQKDPESVVDVFIKTPEGEWYIDITTVKPNLKEFRILRKKMLRWVALRLSQDPPLDLKIHTCIGIPYNPYHPKSYARWTGVECHPDDLLVQNDLWAICAGYDVFDELIAIFQEIGQEMKEEIKKFTQ